MITDQDYIKASDQSGIEIALIKTVADVESRGSGFLRFMYPKILFEAHQFSRRTAHVYDVSYPHISSVKWNRGLYLGGRKEYMRLAEAMLLNKISALLSTSWGKFQIMGFNHRACGFETVELFVIDMFKSEYHHLIAFLKFIDSTHLKEHLINKEWDKFAYGYNGKGYKKNRYDEKLQTAYENFNSD